MCEQGANSVADKSEYIWEGYAFKKTVKGLKYRKQKKGNWMFCKIYKENQKELEKCTTSIVCVSYEIWFKAKINKVKLIFYQPSTQAAQTHVTREGLACVADTLNLLYRESAN